MGNDPTQGEMSTRRSSRSCTGYQVFFIQQGGETGYIARASRRAFHKVSANRGRSRGGKIAKRTMTDRAGRSFEGQRAGSHDLAIFDGFPSLIKRFRIASRGHCSRPGSARAILLPAASIRSPAPSRRPRASRSSRPKPSSAIGVLRLYEWCWNHPIPTSIASVHRRLQFSSPRPIPRQRVS